MARPRLLADFAGQPQARANLSVFIEAARRRRDVLDHVLLVGPPGVGKTSLARIVACELGSRFRASSGPAISSPADIAGLFEQIEHGDVLFIDEIHRLRPAIEELLYPAMEDYELERADQTPPAKIKLPKFTLVGATTRAGLLTRPLRQRFGIAVELAYYSERDLEEIISDHARALGIGIAADGAAEIACRARGTPRTALWLLRRVHDFATVAMEQTVDAATANRALLALGVDTVGLDAMDRRYLATIVHTFGGGPVGLATLGAALSESEDVLEAIEPFLIQRGFLARSTRGRLATRRAFEHVGAPKPPPGTDDDRALPAEALGKPRIVH